MAVDYSPMIEANKIMAASIAGLGKDIGEGIEKYQKNKEITAVTLASIEGILASNPDLIALGQAEEGSIGKSFKQLQEDGTLNQRSAREVKGYLDTIMESRAAQRQAKMDDANLAASLASTEATQQATQQRGSLFDSKLAMANLGVETAQQAYDYNEAINPMLREGIALRNLQTEQGTSIAAKADARADAQEARAATLADQTQEERVQRMEIARSAEDRAVAAMYQRDPVSAKKLQSAQEYMDANDLVFVDGQLYEKSGWFNGSATRVDNPSHLRIEGMQTLRDISINLEGAQGGNSVLPPGYAIEPLDDQALGTNQDTNAVTSAALQSVAPSNPEGSRAGRFIRGIGGALDTGAQTMIQMGESAIASVPASAEYLFGEGDLSYSDAQQKYEDPMRRKRLNTPRSRALQGR